MTTADDLDRLVTSWLRTAGPADVRPGVVDDALDRAARTAQRRRLAAWLLGPGAWPAERRGERLGERLGAPSRAVRLALVTGLVALAAAALVLAAGSLLRSSPFIEEYTGVFEGFGPDVYSGAASIVALPDGRVLDVGTTDFRTVRAFDPDRDSSIELGRILVDRADPLLVLLSDGRVLVLGGDMGPGDVSGTRLPDPATAEVFDPRAGTSVATGPLLHPDRRDPSGILLRDGRVLVAGGMVRAPFPSDGVADAELYDPVANAFVPAAGPIAVAGRPALVRLGDGRVLVAAALDPAGGTLERFDPSDGSFAPLDGWPEGDPGPIVAAVPIADGRALVIIGGCEGARWSMPDGPIDPSELGPARTLIVGDEVVRGPDLAACVSRAVGLPNGQVLVFAWQPDAGTNENQASLLDPATGRLRPVAAPLRHDADAVVLPDGVVVLAGGYGDEWPLPWGEVFR